METTGTHETNQSTEIEASTEAVPSTETEEPAPPACSSPEFRQFDFWIGEWDLTWGDEGKGTNVITAILDNCVIQENFDAAPTGTFRGTSMSTYDSAQERWKQTWVDNSGGYLDFVGGLEGERMVFTREAVRERKPLIQRMS